jgi:glutamyl-tRNA reductase
LESAVFLETDIARQVKQAYAGRVLPKLLHFAFQKAFKIAKSIRTEFLLHQENPTLLGVLWQLAVSTFPDMRKRRVLLVGNSAIHRRFAVFLQRKGVLDLTMCSRGEVIGQSMTREELSSWNTYDLVSCATDADHFLIHGEGRGNLIFDLSVPRVVHPEVMAKLFNIEEIQGIVQSQRDSALVEAFLQTQASKIRMQWIAREGDDISDVLHAGHE